MISLDRLTAEILSLPSASRAIFADKLIESLEFDIDTSIQSAWSASALKRRDEVRNIKDKTASSPLGIDGGFYLENLPTGNQTALVEYEGGECRFEISVPSKEGMVIELGQLTCSNSDRLSPK